MTSASRPAYLMAQLNVKNFDDYFERYAMPTQALFAKYGAEILVATSTPVLLEGAWSANWTVVIRFDSLELATAFYNSPQYQPLKALRTGELTEPGALVLVDGFDPAPFGL